MFDRLDSRSGGLVWLDEGGTRVSVACYKAPTMNGIRIGPVYTPPELRRRGYAGAVTAATTQLMLDRGYGFACLYTDAGNATANHVYESIGYAFVADSIQYRFMEGPE
jgi:predicted GNAT family acetyltransferase